MRALLAPLRERADYEEIIQERKKGEGLLQIAGCVNSQKSHLMYELGDGYGYRLIVLTSIFVLISSARHMHRRRLISSV